MALGNGNNEALQKKNSLLIRIYDCLNNILSHYCSVVTEYLDSIENVYDLLAEYTARVNLNLNYFSNNQ